MSKGAKVKAVSIFCANNPMKLHYPAFEALILRDLMFNRSLKSGLVSFCIEEVKGKHWEKKYTIIL